MKLGFAIACVCWTRSCQHGQEPGKYAYGRAIAHAAAVGHHAPGAGIAGVSLHHVWRAQPRLQLRFKRP